MAIDVLMRVVSAKGPLEAESGTEFAQAMDSLRFGFVTGEFCELTEFGFAAGVAAALSGRGMDEEVRDRLPGAPGETDRRRTAQQTLERQQLRQGARHQAGDFVDMQPVRFTRVMDCMSTRLFQALVDCETLETVSVVKRKATGSVNSGDCYLRLDFSKVLMTDLAWRDNEHVMIETGAFIYRKMAIRYRPQQPDGKLGAVVQSEWTMKTTAGAG